MELKVQEIKGLDEFLRKIGEMSVKKVLNKSIRKSIFTVERTAKRNTPVDTGLLRNSYETKFKDLDGRLRNFREYWPYVEANQHFFSRSISQEQRKIYNIFERDMENFLDDLAK